MTQNENPIYFLIEILEDNIIQKLWDIFKLEKYVNEYHATTNIDEVKKSIRIQYHNDPEIETYQFQTYFKAKLNKKIDYSLKVFADLNFSSKPKFKEYVTKLYDYKNSLKQFESEHLLFVDEMYQRFDLILNTLKPVDKTKKQNKEPIPHKSTLKRHQQFRDRIMEIVKDTNIPNVPYSEAFDIVAKEFGVSSRTIERAYKSQCE
jgi:hypothetical protein